MAQIFWSHSKRDKDIMAYFDSIFAGVEVRGVRVEFERFEPPAAKYIMGQISESEALFVLLGPNIPKTSATQAWVGFEIGYAAATRRPIIDIWVFEPTDYAPVDFPVPFLHHYMPYDMRSKNDRLYISEIAKTYKRSRLLRAVPVGYKLVVCAHCKSGYHLHKDIGQLNCPVCRSLVRA